MTEAVAIQPKIDHEQKTSIYTSWGDKLLQHTDVLYDIQHRGVFRPISIIFAANEICDSDCPFCSVAGRPLKSFMPFSQVKKVLTDFRDLGAKSIEITGGGNPLLYRDKEAGKDVNDIIGHAYSLGYHIGIVTNSHNLKRISPKVHHMIDWIRISLIQLDEGKNPEDYNFCGFLEERVSFSYIIYETAGVDSLSWTKRTYEGTTPETIKRIAKLVDLHPKIKFVRLLGDCLTKGNNFKTREKYRPVVEAVDRFKKFFIKDIGEDDGPYDHGCYVGAIRPYIAAHPDGGNHQVYICPSMVLDNRVYNLEYSLGSVDDIPEIWGLMNTRYQATGFPYEVKGNGGTNWCETCTHCYYKFNNKTLHGVAQVMPNPEFS